MLSNMKCSAFRLESCPVMSDSTDSDSDSGSDSDDTLALGEAQQRQQQLQWQLHRTHLPQAQTTGVTKRRRLLWKQPSYSCKRIMVYAEWFGIRPSQLYLMVIYRLPPIMFWIIKEMPKTFVNTKDTAGYFAGCKNWTKGTGGSC